MGGFGLGGSDGCENEKYRDRAGERFRFNTETQRRRGAEMQKGFEFRLVGCKSESHCTVCWREAHFTALMRPTAFGSWVLWICGHFVAHVSSVCCSRVGRPSSSRSRGRTTWPSRVASVSRMI